MLHILQDYLTRLYASLRGGVTDVEEYSAYGILKTVYWFEQDSKRLGDYSPFGTILLNERAKTEFPEQTTEYVFLHEMGHARDGIVIRTIMWCLLIAFGFLALGGIVSLPALVLQAVVQTPSLYLLPAYVSSVILVVIFASLLFIITSWFDELRADLFAISKIGRQEFKTLRSYFHEQSDRGFLRKCWYHARYPPAQLILWVARWREVG